MPPFPKGSVIPHSQGPPREDHSRIHLTSAPHLPPIATREKSEEPGRLERDRENAGRKMRWVRQRRGDGGSSVNARAFEDPCR